jgi:hypothetical protein
MELTTNDPITRETLPSPGSSVGRYGNQIAIAPLSTKASKNEQADEVSVNDVGERAGITYVFR